MPRCLAALSLASSDRPRGLRPLLTAFVLGLFMAFALVPPARAGEIRVVASVPPLYFLLATVMEGADNHDLELLIPSGASPHDHSLRPSDLRKIAGADLVFWVGPALETSLARVLDQPELQQKSITLGTATSLHRLRQRRVANGMTPVVVGTDESEDKGAVDPHLWLDPRNAAAIIDLAAAVLAAQDPEHGALYERNATAAKARLAALDQALTERLAPLRDKRFITFHDATQYFEARYGLRSIGFVITHPEHPTAGARHLRDLRRRAADTDARCLFIELEYDPALARPVMENSSLRLAVLDHMGARLPLAGESYFTLMEKLAEDLGDCLAAR